MIRNNFYEVIMKRYRVFCSSFALASCLFLGMRQDACGMERLKNFFGGNQSSEKAELYNPELEKVEIGDESLLEEVKRPKVKFNVDIDPPKTVESSESDVFPRSLLRVEDVIPSSDFYSKTLEGALKFTKYFQDGSFETTLNLTCDYYNDEANYEPWIQFFQGIKNLNHLRFVILGLNKALSKVMEEHLTVNTLESIEADDSFGLHKSMDALKEIVNRSPNLKKIRTWRSMLRTDWTTPFFIDLKPLPSLEILDFTSNCFNSVGLDALANFLKGSPKLKSLKLGWAFTFNFGPDSARRLAETLMACSLNEFLFGSAPSNCVQAMLMMLSHPTLEQLTFTGSDIPDNNAEHAKDIGKALAKNTKLKEFSLNCLNTTEQVVAFCDAVRGNNTLTFLDLRNCNLADAKAIFALTQMLKENTSLIQLGLIFTKLDFIGALEILLSRKNSPALEVWLDKETALDLSEVIPELLKSGNVIHSGY